MAAEVIGSESDVPHDELFRMGVNGRFVLHHSVVFEALQEGGLAGVVESQEYQVGALLVEPDVGERVVESIG